MVMTGDLKTNMKLDGGLVKCHNNTDLTLTPSGDLALINNDADGMKQRMLIWLAVPAGELFDPLAGCPAYDFFHTKLTSANMQALANQFTNSIQYCFPEVTVDNVEVTKTDQSTVFVEVYSSTSDAIGFMYNMMDVNSLRVNMWNTWAVNNLIPFANQQI